MPITKKIQLMTYPDSLGGNLPSLATVVNTYLSKAVSGIHILPPYPSSADRGFCPLTHLEIDEKWGTWADIQSLTGQYDILLDLVCGHISDQSLYVQDYLANGQNSEFSDMFLPLSKVYKDGHITLEEIERLAYLTPIPPFINLKFADGTVVTHWKTFMPYQIELDASSPKTRELYLKFLDNLAEKGIKMIRLDAVETIAKDRTLGYHLVPAAYDFIEWITKESLARGVEVLCEVFGFMPDKQRVLDMGAWVYDFNLPDIIFHAIFNKTTHNLRSWYATVPRKTISVLSNHDGFMVGRFCETLSPEEAATVRAKIFENAGQSSQQASGVGSNNIATDGINATLYEALFRDQDDWFVAQALHIFSPGIPQMYYNDLLAQRNDEELYHQTGEGRSLVRHNHQMDQLDHKFRQPIVQKVIKLMEIRNNHPAFLGDVSVVSHPDMQVLHLLWQADGSSQVHIKINLKTHEVLVEEISASNQIEVLFEA